MSTANSESELSDEEFDTEDFDLEQELRDLYHSPGTGYRSIENLYREVKDDGFDVTREQVRNF